METRLFVTSYGLGIRPPAPTAIDDAPEQGPMVQIGLLLKDKLKVTGEGEHANEVKMKQCCYEKKTITMRFKKVEDTDHVKEEVIRVLRDQMHMVPESARTISPLVARKVLQEARMIKQTIIGFWTILVEVHVECNIKRTGEGDGAPFGERGFARLKQRLADGAECSICQEEFKSSKDIVVTPCNHIFDRSCIKRWLVGRSQSCPMCRADLAPLVRKRIPL